jgi:hypothetical protein
LIVGVAKYKELFVDDVDDADDDDDWLFGFAVKTEKIFSDDVYNEKKTFGEFEGFVCRLVVIKKIYFFLHT